MELPKIIETELGKSILATEMYDYIDSSKSQYSRFIKNHLLKNPYCDEKDFAIVKEEVSRHGRYRQEYFISFSLAVKICSTIKSEKSAKLLKFLSDMSGVEYILVRPKRKELIFVDMLAEMFDLIFEFETQKICGKYRLDLYCVNLNLAIEHDGVHHKFQIEKDQERDNYLKVEFGIETLRVKEGEELKAINHIIHTYFTLQHKYLTH